MKNILLLIESFMGYDLQLIETASKYYNVTVVYNNQYWEDVHRNIHDNIILRAIRKIKIFRPLITEIAGNKYLNNYISTSNTRDYYDYVFCINGYQLPDSYYAYLKRQYPKAKFILYLYDDVSNLAKHSYFKYFDYRYSYNIDDCALYDFKYMAMFIQDVELPKSDTKERIYDLAIIGTAHKDRLELVKKIYEMYRSKYKFYIYMYHPTEDGDFFWHKEPLSYFDYASILRKSKVVIDIPGFKQTGPTTRPLDAYFTKTKVLTTSENITKYPIYSDNIAFLNRNDPVIEETFVNKEYVPVNRDVKNCDGWLKEILEDDSE